MSSKRLSWVPQVNEWYQCRNVQDRYRIVRMSSGRYWVVSWLTSYNVAVGSLNDCRRYVFSNCMSHDEYSRRYYNGKK